MTNVDHTGRRAVVHAIDPADLGLPPRPDGRSLLLYAYEGEELCSVLEGNGFCFPGSDLHDSFLHCQGDQILSSEQNLLGVYFPFFPHEDALITEETAVVPSQEIDIMGVDPLKVMAWEESCGSATTGTSLGLPSGMSAWTKCGGPLGIRKTMNY